MVKPQKIFKIIQLILMIIFSIIAAIALTVMIDIATETGGAPGYSPGAIFNFWLIVAGISATMLIFLSYLDSILNSIINFLRKK